MKAIFLPILFIFLVNNFARSVNWNFSSASNIDFNQDGKADLALVGNGTWKTIPVAVSKGTSGFTVSNNSYPDFPKWSYSGVPLIGDFDGDNATDIAITSGENWGTIPVAFSDGDGTFTVTNKAVTNFPRWAATSRGKVLTGDYDGDGMTDISLMGQSDWGTIPVAFSNGDGSFQVTNEAVSNFPSWSSSSFTLSGDFNNDGFSDIALTCGVGWKTIPVAYSNGDGTFRVTNKYHTDFAGWAGSRKDLGGWPSTKYAYLAMGIAGDFNGDNKTDIALLSRSTYNTWISIPVALSNGSDGTFTIVNKTDVGYQFQFFAGQTANKLIGDFDGNKCDDILVFGGNTKDYYESYPRYYASIAYSDCDGSFSVKNREVGLASTDHLELQVGDFDNDGFDDIVYFQGDSKGLRVIYGCKNKTINSPTSFTDNSSNQFSKWSRSSYLCKRTGFMLKD